MAETGPPWTLVAPGLSVVETDIAVSVLRVREFDEFAAAALGQAFALTWPSAPNTIVGDRPRVAWLAPGEWAIFGAEAVIDRVSKACQGRLHHLADVSAGRRLWRLEGPRSRELIAKGCSLDTHPRVLGPGSCAQTMLAQVPVLLIPGQGHLVFEVMADATLAGHLRTWIADAALEYQA